MGIFSEVFSWWGGNTWSNRIYTLLRGRLVGTDECGNRYYVQSKGVGPLGVPRRWVIYRDLAEASQVSPGLARLAALHRRHAAVAGDIFAAALAKAASHEHDRHAERLSSVREHPLHGQTAAGHRRLQALAAALR